MLARVRSAAVLGIDSYIVEVECNLSKAEIPRFLTVGLPEGAVKESKERVWTAIRNSGHYIPAKKIVINLAPADIRKEGSAFDLPMAVGILTAAGAITYDKLEHYAILGELSLDGSLRPVKGVLPITLAVAENGLDGIIVPFQNAREAAVTDSVDIIPVKSLRETIDFLNSREIIPPFRVDIDQLFEDHRRYWVDFSDVKGQDHVKRALEVAAAGGHNIIMIGPPGSGKTMLAKRIPTILPNLTLDEALETTKIHSVSGLVEDSEGIVATRPFRSPHHTISDAALVGGGKVPRPGEVSLAHHGVLFLDELPEFKKNVLEVLRQPLENDQVTISRAQVSLTYPANFMLVAAMNPCPCGYATDPNHDCMCSPQQIQRYMTKISGPLLDRIDIHIEVPAVRFSDLASKREEERSEIIRNRVQSARQIQRTRFSRQKHIFCNADMGPKMIRDFCSVDKQCRKLLKLAITKLGLSARAYDRILKVSRTIADVEGEPVIKSHHISEAIQYRSLDRQLWL